MDEDTEREELFLIPGSLFWLYFALKRFAGEVQNGSPLAVSVKLSNISEARVPVYEQIVHESGRDKN